jgi:hypothetical protein
MISNGKTVKIEIMEPVSNFLPRLPSYQENLICLIGEEKV